MRLSAQVGCSFHARACFLRTCQTSETAATSPLQRENLLTPAGLCGQAWDGLGRFSQDTVRLELPRLTSLAETQWRWDYMSHHALGLSGGQWVEPLIQEVLKAAVKDHE